jgi:peptide/nickel transport system permease protein
MVSVDRFKEKLRAYRKVFKQNWDLFKASKIGIVGIIIMLFFVGMAVIAPFLGLRDPINWRAPDADIIHVTSWWDIGRNVTQTQWNAEGPINHTVSFRVKAASAQATEADRIYFTAGNRLYSLRPSDAGSYWTDGGTPAAFDFVHVTDSPFSTDVAIANFGDQYNPDRVDYLLGVGTDDGYIYIIEDYAANDLGVVREPTPSVQNGRVFMEQLESAVTSVALYSNPTSGREPMEKYYFGTQDGYIYAYSVTELDNEHWTFGAGDWTEFILLENEIRPSPRTNHSMAYDSIHDRIVLFGGFDGLLNDETWMYDPDTGVWTRINTDPHPSARYGHSMAFDASNGDVVLFGGIIDNAQNPSGETWTFNVTTSTWTLMPGPGPQARAFSAMAFDAGTGRTVLFGGDHGSDETWTYENATGWTQSSPATWPSARFGHAMAFDSVNGYSILYGGNGSVTDTWTYDSLLDIWYDLFTPTNPSPRMYHSMAFNVADSQALLFGGQNDVSNWDETWAYDYVTNQWTQLTPTENPSGRSGTSMVYDSTRDQVHLFGGDDEEFSRLWYRQLSTEDSIQMSGFPLNTPTDPNYSPALNKDGSLIFVNDGGLRALYTTNGTDAWDTDSLDMGEDWTNPPVVAIPDKIGSDFVEIVYATTNHGWIYGRYTNNGSALASWEERALDDNMTATSGGIPIMINVVTPDGGVLTTPDFFGDLIYVGSSSGYMYAIRRDPLPDQRAGSTVWKYSDRILLNAGFGFTGGVRFARESRLLFAVGYEGYDTPKDYTDDIGTIFTLGEDGNLSWRKSFDGRIGGTPSIWKDNEGAHPTPSVWFGTSFSVAHAFSSTGENMAPLAPGCYPSGNCYGLGTDAQGRDIFSQLFWGSQIALTVGLLAAAGSIGIGTIIGLVAGYSGGRIDSVLMRFTDVILVLPGLPFLIILAAVLGPSYWNIIFVLTIIGWPGTARVIRSEVLSLKERPFIDSARVTGASSVRIMFKHLAPNVMPLAFLYMTLAVSGSILSEAALSFLGLGDVNTPSWGQMLQAVQTENVLAAWWWLLPPGIAITFISLAFYLIGRAFEQIVNPRLRKR